MSNLNWIDYVIIAIFLLSVLGGINRGFVKEVISLVTLIAAFFIATMFAHPLASAMTQSQPVQNMINQASATIGMSTEQPLSYAAIGLSFGLLFAGTVLVGSLVSYFLNVAFQTGVLGVGNRLMGGIFGLGRGVLIILVLIFIVQLTPFASQPAWQQSQFVIMFQPAVQWLGEIVSPTLANLRAKFGQTFQDVGSQLQGLTQ